MRQHRGAREGAADTGAADRSQRHGCTVKSHADVIVIGAGASGQKAARELVEAGRDVIVLEAHDRVGGRLKPAELAGRKIDLGGQWAGIRHSVLLAEAERLGVPTYKQYDSGNTI